MISLDNRSSTRNERILVRYKYDKKYQIRKDV